MLNFGRHINGTSRLMIGLFAIQVLAAGLCLLTPQVHAADMSGMKMPTSAGMGSHCESAATSEPNHAGHDAACAHCDVPDQFMQIKAEAFNVNFESPVLIFAITDISLSVSVSIGLAVRTPTGSPRSSSILYTTSQRILI